MQEEKSNRWEALARRSVFLNNFKHAVDVEELEREMNQFGEVDRILPSKGEKSKFAVVEFKEADAAQNLLHSIRRLKIGKSMLRVQPRRADFDDANQAHQRVSQQDQISAQNAFECLESANCQPTDAKSGFYQQLDALIAKFAISNESIAERARFAANLEQYLQKYFACPIHIRVFGSSSTGLGFINSDLDMNMVFDDDLKDTDSGSSIDCSSNANSHEADYATSMDLNVRLTPENLANQPIDMDDFNNLSKINRVRLLNRLMNAFRKEHSLITAHVPVPEARTPIVRLVLRNPRGLPCEISVQNLLGECKANFVRDVVRAETTGKLWRLLFLFKLWASTNGLFTRDEQRKKRPVEKPKASGSGLAQKGGNDIEMEEGEEEETSSSNNNKDEPQLWNQHPSAHWNSYTLSLCAIAFLQHQHQMPPIEQLIRPNSRRIRGWPIEYDMPFFQLNEDIPILLKGLLTFMYQQLKEDRVVALREGRIYGVKEFKEKCANGDNARIGKYWRFSTVNVQDPLELLHNVASNVRRESLAKMRWKVMYAISAIKRSPNDIRQLFRLESVKKLQEERRAEKKQNKMKRAQENGEIGSENMDGKEEEAVEMEMDQT